MKTDVSAESGYRLPRAIFAAALLLLASCASCVSLSGSGTGAPAKTDAPFSPSRIALSPWEPETDAAPEGELARYAAYYGLEDESWRWSVGAAESRGREVAAMRFAVPGARKGTVFFVHGFLLHSGFWFRHLRFLLDEGWNLVLVDLPGHGLSDGVKGDVDDFSRYGDALRAVIERVEEAARTDEGAALFPRPWIAAGHSTGCAAWLEWSFESDIARFRRYVFLAPLVRNVMWEFARAGDFLTHGRVPWLPAADPDRPEDPEYRAAMDDDPFWPALFPYRWPRALFRWNDALASRTVAPLPLSILQGDSDGVVDWKWNLSFYRSRIPDVSIRIFPGLGHEILFDVRERVPEVRAAMLEEILSEAREE